MAVVSEQSEPSEIQECVLFELHSAKDLRLNRGVLS